MGRLQVECRIAQTSDTTDVHELTSKIWEREDYVPRVWEEWLKDPQGRLIVATYQEHVIGLGKLSQLSDVDWWMQGLRVHPDYEV